MESKQYDHIIKNHGFFEKRFNDLEGQIKEVKKINKEIYDILDWLQSKIK